MKYGIIFFAMLLLSSCGIYNSDVPISNSEKSSIDARILGRWFSAEIDEENKLIEKSDFFFELLDFNSREYAILATSPEGSVVLKMHDSKIKDKTFYNVVSISNDKEEKPSWFFFTIDNIGIEEGTFRLVTDSLKQNFKKSKDLEKFLVKNYDKLFREWMSRELKIYREEYFLWDKVNSLKTNDIEEVSRINEDYNYTRDKTAAQLSISAKTVLDKKTTAYFLANSYQSYTDKTGFAAQFSLFVKFNDGSTKILDFSANNVDFYDRSTDRFYKVKPGVSYPKE
jgi:hypothetical protein